MNRKLFFDTFFTFSNNILKLFFGIIVSIIVARVLGPHYKGIYSLIILLPSILSMFFNVGINASIIYLKGRKGYCDEFIINRGIYPVIFLSIIALMTGILIVLFLRNVFFEGVHSQYLIISIIVIPFNFSTSLFMSLIYSRENFRQINLMQLFLRSFNMLLILLVILNRSILYLLIVDIVTSIVGLIIVYYYSIKMKQIVIKPYYDMMFIKEMMSFALKIHMTNIVTFFHYKADLLIINIFLSPFFVGLYSLAVNTVEKVWMVSSSVSTVVYPKMTNINERERINLTNASSRIVFSTSLILVVVLFLLADSLIPLFYGNAYIGSILPLKILLIGILMMSISRILSNYMAADSKPQITMFSKTGTFILNIIINIILIPRYGIAGAALATTVSYTLNAVIVIIIYCKLTATSLSNIMILKSRDFKNMKNILK